MRIIIVGPVGSGKTTLLHKIIRMNNTFNFIIDGPIQADIPNVDNLIMTAQSLDVVPAYLLQNSLILRCPDVRN